MKSCYRPSAAGDRYILLAGEWRSSMLKKSPDKEILSATSRERRIGTRSEHVRRHGICFLGNYDRFHRSELACREFSYEPKIQARPSFRAHWLCATKQQG